MTRKIDVEDFLKQKKIAVAGVSRKSSKFGNVIYRELREKGYRVFAINANTSEVEGDTCYHDLKSLPEAVDALIIVLKPAQTELVVKEAATAGIKRVWLQQGAHSDAAFQFCKDNNMTVIARECLLMYLEPVTSIHKFHRWLKKIFGNLPQ